MDETRLVAREGLRKILEKQDAQLQRTGNSGHDDARDQAIRMISSPVVRRVGGCQWWARPSGKRMP